MSAFAQHSRNNSYDSASTGTSYQLILEHILSYPGTYEIPLRTMYTLNCAPRGQTGPNHSPSASTASGSTSPTATSTEASAALFASSLMSQISQLPQQPTSLPPAFCTSFVRRCFPTELTLVDFPQSLTALDYLRDLNRRREKELAAAFKSLGVEKDTFTLENSDRLQRYPKLALWGKETIRSVSKLIEPWYAQIYVGLRTWVMINELSLTPFNATNCYAMLNTLYPPANIMTPQPCPILTPEVLAGQRKVWMDYIKAVKQSGTKSLAKLMAHGARPGEETGWPKLQEDLNKYLRAANAMIEECTSISAQGLDYFGPPEDLGKRKGRKTDSGVSFGSNQSRRPSSSGTTSSKEWPQMPQEQSSAARKAGSTLEKIAREFRKIRTRKIEVDEIIDQSAPEPQPKGLRKMRSMGTLAHESRTPSASSTRKASDTPVYDIDEMLRTRMIYEANKAKNINNTPR